MEYKLNELIAPSFHADACLICEDEGLREEGIAKGDVVFLDCSAEAEANVKPGELVAVNLDGECRLARIWIQDDYILLVCGNNQRHSLFVGKERERVMLIGKAVCVNHRLNGERRHED